MPNNELMEAGFPYADLMDIGDIIMKQFDLPMSTQIEPNYGYLIWHKDNHYQYDNVTQLLLKMNY